MTRAGRTAAAKPGASAVFLKKALELQGAMSKALDDRQWNAGGLLGVHAAIAASDSLASKLEGRHSTGQAHDDAVVLVRGLGVQESGLRADQLAEIISWKHVAAYEDRELTAEEARILAKRVVRFVAWVVRVTGEREHRADPGR